MVQTGNTEMIVTTVAIITNMNHGDNSDNTRIFVYDASVPGLLTLINLPPDSVPSEV